MEVISNKDNMVVVKSNTLVQFKNTEIISFSNGVLGFVVNSFEKQANVALLDDGQNVKMGSVAKKSGSSFSVNIPSDFLGGVYDYAVRKINIDESIIKPVPIYKLKNIYNDIPIESTITTIDSREDIDVPLSFGNILIDATLPVGRGQRQLIIGDRETGKTSIALGAILSQKNKDVVCIYVSIARKKTDVLNIYKELHKNDALKYTSIFYSSPSDTPGANFTVAYTAMAVAEKFKDEGKDVLIVFDDLSSHARAYRTISLLSEIHVGREGYPGDIFYIHSRLLERSGNFNKNYGGGSITSLPIVETQKEDISDFISTNIISITDGQIFTSVEKFNFYERPAININLSVSRVGGKAQFIPINKESGSLKAIIAQANQILKTMTSEETLSKLSKQIISKYRVLNELSIQKTDDILSPAQELAYLSILNWGILESFETKDMPIIKNAINNFMLNNTVANNFLKWLDQELPNIKKYKNDFIFYYIKIIFGPFLIWLSLHLYKEETFDKIEDIYEFDSITFNVNDIFDKETKEGHHDKMMTQIIEINSGSIKKDFPAKDSDQPKPKASTSTKSTSQEKERVEDVIQESGQEKTKSETPNQTPDQIEPKEETQTQTPNQMEPKEETRTQTHNQMEPKEETQTQTHNQMEPKEETQTQTHNQMEPKEETQTQTHNQMEPKEETPTQTPDQIEPREETPTQTPNQMEPREETQTHKLGKVEENTVKNNVEESGKTD